MDKNSNIVVGIDLDNCITADENSKEFFKVICHLLHPEYEIHIISNRGKESKQDTIRELKELVIQYSQLTITSNKAGYILQEGINILFEDTDEYFLEIPESTTVFKIREDGNFSFAENKWVGNKKTTKMIDE